MLRQTQLKEIVTQVLDEYQADDIICLDVRGTCNFTDDLVIASAGSIRHLATLGEAVVMAVKRTKSVCRIQGLKQPECGWVLIDLGDLIVHLMLPEQREFYQLEALWSGSDVS